VKTSSILLLSVLLISSAAADAGEAKPYTSLEDDKLLDFRYSFPTAVGSYPELLAEVRKDQQKARSEVLDAAREDATFRAKNNFPFNAHEFWRDWTTTGETARLLGLQSRTDFFTGGAHPNHTSAWLLWDKQRKTAIALRDLFATRDGFWKSIESDYCPELDAERRRRDSPGTVPCPSADKLTIEFLDPDLDWRFDTLRIIADPYVAGSYAEGTYAVILPVTPELIALLKPEYRDSFEAQLQ
jgi:hypothetical protein